MNAGLENVSLTAGVIVKLPKKGDLTDCNNWRGITLLSILLETLRQSIDIHLREEQAGFRPNTVLYRADFHFTEHC